MKELTLNRESREKEMSIVARSGYANTTVGNLLWQHALGLIVGQNNFVDGIAAVLEGNIVAVDVGWKEDFCCLLGEVHNI